MAASRSLKLFYASPIIVILGATGTGKSKLAIEVAKRFKGEIISADAMQMYKGLDIATNKVTQAEQDGVPHHLLGFWDPMKILTVCEFRDRALSQMKAIFDRQNVPIIVGGTNYYIESILYDFLLNPPNWRSASEREKTEAEEDGSENEESPRKKPKPDYEKLIGELERLDNEELHAKLTEVDPEMAEKVHPNDRRKVLRAIGVFLEKGEKLSSLLKKQRSQFGGCDSGGPLRFTNSIILWLQCDLEVLNPRLDARVDAMLSDGLIDELLDFHKRYKQENLANNKNPDYTKGIFQSIGFKEFHEYLVMEEERRESEEGRTLRENGVELLKLATRQYAKHQIRWIKNRLLKNGRRQIPPIYGLDGSDVSQWKEKVFDVAENIVESHLSGKKPSVEPLPSENTKVVIDRIYKCDVCQKVSLGEVQFGEHLRSKKHQKMVKRKKRLEELESKKIEVEAT